MTGPNTASPNTASPSTASPSTASPSTASPSTAIGTPCFSDKNVGSHRSRYLSAIVAGLLALVPSVQGQGAPDRSHLRGESPGGESRTDEDVRIHDERLYEKSAKAAQAAMAYYGEYDHPEETLR